MLYNLYLHWMLRNRDLNGDYILRLFVGIFIQRYIKHALLFFLLFEIIDLYTLIFPNFSSLFVWIIGLFALFLNKNSTVPALP